jgi:opacity protein-like surface antigen
MHVNKIFIIATLLTAFGYNATAQDTTATDLLADIEKETAGKEAGATKYTIATFKTTRLIAGHSSENVAKGVMDVKISHRFGTLNRGAYELFGLDNATMRMGVDYGITDYLMAGVGRSTFEKTYDAFLKLKILRQSTGGRNMPISLSYVPTIALKTLKNQNPELNKDFSSRLFYTHQLIIARKFSDKLSLQLMPTFVHRNLVALKQDPNDILAIGIGGRQKLTRRVSINAEYYYLLPGSKLDGTTNSLSVGFDIETGGHVFQLHFTNSQGMNERTFISETTGKWEKGDILFGFNISRVFTIGKRR